MNSQVLIKINNFIKNRLIEIIGIILMIASIFLLMSIISYSPSDPNFIYTPENVQIKNIWGFYGSVISDFFLQSLGLVSFLLVFNFFYWGMKIASKKMVGNFITKSFFIFLYISFGTTALNIFDNTSFWLIDNGNGGFVGRIIKENIFYFTSAINNQYVIYLIILFTIIFFILSLEMNKNGITKILFFPFNLFKKIKNIFSKVKKENINNMNYSEIEIESEKNDEDKNILKGQPFLPFSEKKKEQNNGKSHWRRSRNN